MPTYWMITDRNVEANRLGQNQAAPTYWVSDGDASLDLLTSWTNVSADQFKTLLLAAAAQFPLITDPERHEDQKHVTLYVHGYNNSWEDAVLRYQQISQSLFEGAAGLGLCVLFTWPSRGQPLAYWPDRAAAEACAPDLFNVLTTMYDWLAAQQTAALMDPAAPPCRAKTSMIAHSMGNYVMQKAMRRTWTRHNQPLLMSLLNQLVMVAADVDNDLFKSGERIEQSDGDAIANLTYRVTALYTGRDPVLGASAGLKHFGKRRLGRSGLDPTVPVPDNVWEVDCSDYFPPLTLNIHSGYFDQPEIQEILRRVLRGVDRTLVLDDIGSP
ncbi:MAG TPA: alpha/beta hydrolase [Gemmataceae bacterium]|nr:alpha/beta hydrolase [Gemmataceae bacterium]